ncbi:hypothetical protein EGH82_08320 [Vibrio ponticus]|uniref:Uncharacterized protein n=1 Tax=Vibrio ponticus TaxID=265668 RepID=A0A3N3E1K0_9VIBR|nr:hypothetical protein EGH82_08320 [Vibrio ponticus]
MESRFGDARARAQAHGIAMAINKTNQQIQNLALQLERTDSLGKNQDDFLGFRCREHLKPSGQQQQIRRLSDYSLARQRVIGPLVQM